MKNIKIKNSENNNAENSHQGKNKSATTLPKYKTLEEYYQETLDLKRSLKVFENNELIYKAKFEYYENEMNKKEQEILELLDVKKVFFV